MIRYVFAGLLILVIVVITGFPFSRTETPMQAIATAEFGGVSLRIDYATTTEMRERGLGGKKDIPNDYGMLFVFPNGDRYGFWMKDMLKPVDIFWLNDKGQVVSIAQDVATSTYPNVFYPVKPARYVLETAAGFAREYSIATGTPLLLKSFELVSE